MSGPWRHDAFWHDMRHAVAPLAIWAGHFFAAYAFIAIACRAGLDARPFGGMTLLSATLAAGTVVALSWLGLIIARTRGAARVGCGNTGGSGTTGGSGKAGDRGTPEDRGRAGGGLAAIRLGLAILSFAAVAWTAPPMILFTSCLQ